MLVCAKACPRLSRHRSCAHTVLPPSYRRVMTCHPMPPLRCCTGARGQAVASCVGGCVRGRSVAAHVTGDGWLASVTQRRAPWCAVHPYIRAPLATCQPRSSGLACIVRGVGCALLCSLQTLACGADSPFDDGCGSCALLHGSQASQCPRAQSCSCHPSVACIFWPPLSALGRLVGPHTCVA